MNYIRIVIGVLVFILTSCKSNISTEPDINTLKVTAHNYNISIGDTLKITIKANINNPISGKVDFNDGFSLILKSRKTSIDTTLNHCYNNTGNYNVEVIIYNNNKILKETITINVSKNIPPRVNISFNQLKLDFKDSLVVNISAYDATLSVGVVDFGDGNIISLSNLRPNCDTTFTHVYSSLGDFNIHISFYDGYDSTENIFIISIQHYYKLFFPVGMTWKYKYRQRFIRLINYEYADTTGVHEWEVQSFSQANKNYIIQITRNDTIINKKADGVDTTYVRLSKQKFSITIEDSSLYYSFPDGYIERIRIPNNVFVKQYPIKVFFPLRDIYCEDIIGLREYRYNYSVSQYLSFENSYKLIEWKK